MKTKLLLSSKFSQSYIAFHGLTDAVHVYTQPSQVSRLVVSYTLPQLSLFILPVNISCILFTIFSAYHFRHNLKSTIGSLLFVSIVSVFRLILITELFLLYHSTIHYKENHDLVMNNKVLVIILSLLTYILVDILSVKQLLGLATGHVIFNELCQIAFLQHINTDRQSICLTP